MLTAGLRIQTNPENRGEFGQSAERCVECFIFLPCCVFLFPVLMALLVGDAGLVGLLG